MIVHTFKEVLEYLDGQEYKFVGIDGTTRAGKSTFARRLSKDLNANLLSADEYMYDSNLEGGYVDWINIGSLNSDLEEIRKRNFTVILEGNCLLKLLENIPTFPDFIIYTRNQYNSDYPSRDISREDFEEIQAEIDAYYAKYPKTGKEVNKEDLETSVARYHYEYKPVSNSDLVYAWRKET